MVKGPFKKWGRVDTFCTLLVDLGEHLQSSMVGLIAGQCCRVPWGRALQLPHLRLLQRSSSSLCKSLVG